MKKKLFFALTVLLTIVMSQEISISSDECPEQLVVVISMLPTHLWMKNVYDEKTPVEVLLQGVLANGCYSLDVTTFEISKDNVIYVKNNMFYKPCSMCTMALKIYSRNLNFGFLKSGKYNVLIQDPGGNYFPFANIDVQSER